MRSNWRPACTSAACSAILPAPPKGGKQTGTWLGRHNASAALRLCDATTTATGQFGRAFMTFLGQDSSEQGAPRTGTPASGERSIVLVGLMGAGKSSIGKRLAERIALPFVDADNEIEAAAGCSIPEIFERHGEAAFRDGERRVIRRLLNGPRTVLATGGGAFMNAETREAIAESGISIWLKADLDTLVRRTARRTNRPLLRQGDPRAILERLMAERYPIYGLADITIETRDGPHDEVVDEIIARLQEREAA